MIRKTLAFLLTAILLFTSCIAAAAPGDEESAGTYGPENGSRNYGIGYTSVLYNSDSGLPTSEANTIVQTADGFIWIGGYSGLIRYDGNSFYRYDSSVGISSVVCLYADSKDRLWIGTNDKGAACMKDDVFTFYNRSSSLRSLSVRSICEDAHGDILIATTMGISYVDSDGALYNINDPQLNKEYVCELVRGNDGVVYGCTLSGSYFTIENKRVSAIYQGSGDSYGLVNTIYPDPDNSGYIYLGMQDSDIYYGRIGSQLSTFERYTVSDGFYTINAIRKIDNMLWVCTDSGIGFFTDDMVFTPLRDVNMNNSVDHIISDYEGNLWFSSSRQGVMKIVRNIFTDISDIAGLSQFVVNSTCLYGNLLYIATDSGLIILDDNYGIVENGLTELLKGVRIRCIKADPEGSIWFCTYSSKGLIKYDPSAGTYVSFNKESGMAADRVRMITVLSDGSVAAATNAGANIIRNGEVVAEYGASSGISNLEILTIEEGNGGVIYLGSDGDGIYVVDGAKVSRLGIDDGLESEVILRIKRDTEDSELFWIITSNSISYMKNGIIKTIRNFPFSNNFDVFFDTNCRIWVICSNGIYVVKRDVMLGDGPIDYIHYDSSCGLPGLATANAYCHLGGDGTLFICNSTGVCSVNINEKEELDSNIKLSVPYITVNDRYVGIDGSRTVRIPSDCQYLNIYANVFTYSLSNPHVSYCLEGFDSSEIECTKKDLGLIKYTNLDGGTYVFRLKLINTMTGNVDKEFSLTIIKEKAFHETPLFFILIVLASVLAVAAVLTVFFMNKTRKLRERNEQNKKLVDEMSDVFAQCIDMKDKYTNGHSTRVANYTAMIARKMGMDSEEIDKMKNIALLHDIGKISIPDAILNKPGRLDDDEFAIMKSHPSRGYEILKNVTIEKDLAIGAGYHHEKYDGSGYPYGKKGDEIPAVAQIISVADTFDAMYSTRPYRRQMSLGDVVSEIKKYSGTQFNPAVVDAFLKLVEEGAFDEEEKTRLRKLLSENEKKLDPEYVSESDKQIAEIVLGSDAFRSASGVFTYVSSGNEPDTLAIIKACFDSGKKVFVPFITGPGTMSAVRIDSVDELVPGKYGILSPADDSRAAAPGEIDLALIPCLSIDPSGTRLGRGGGYYDRYFENRDRKCRCLVLCRESMVSPLIPRKEHDVVFDGYITEKGIYLLT